MLDREHSMSTVEEVLGLGVLNGIEIGLNSYYSCTLGGLIINSNKDPVPTYPMVPINVIEPLLRCLLTDSDASLEDSSSIIETLSEMSTVTLELVMRDHNPAQITKIHQILGQK